MRVDVLVPVELLDDEVEILMFVLGHVFDQQCPGHFAALDDRLEHAEHVAAPLRLIGTQRAGRVQHAGRNQPAGAALQAVGSREIEDAVIALRPIFQTAADVGLGGAWLQAHESVGEVVIDVVVLRRKIIALRLAFLTGQLGVLEALVHVMRDGAHVVEELRVNRPALVLIPHRLADHSLLPLGHRVFKQELLALERAEALPLVPNPAVVGGVGRAGEPAFVDAAAMGAVSVPIARGELDSLAGVQKSPRHPSGREPQQALAGVESPVQHGPQIVGFDDVIWFDGC